MSRTVTATLSRLVSAEYDFAAAWEQHPLHSTGLGPFEDVLSMDDIEDLVRTRGVRAPFLRMIRDGRPPASSSYLRTIGEGASALSGLADPDGVRHELLDGATLVLHGLRLYVPTVAAACDELTDALGHPIHANAFLTPPHSNGAGLHFDNHSVFIRQIAGRKHWQVRMPVQKWPIDPCTSTQGLDTEVVIDTWLGPGECLYLPRGYVHDGHTGDASSLHITFGMLDPYPWADVLLDALRSAMTADERFREILGVRFSDDVPGLVGTGREKLTALSDLVASLDAETLVADLPLRRGPASWDFRSTVGAGDLAAAVPGLT